MQKVLLLIVGAGLLGGCVGPGTLTNTGVMPVGPGTYMVTEKFNNAVTQRRTLTLASDYCQKQNLVFVPSHIGDDETGFTVMFRCLQQNDPRVASFNLEHETPPDVVIQDTRQ